MRDSLWLLAFLLVGCGGGDPTSSRLGRGSDVTVVPGPDRVVRLTRPTPDDSGTKGEAVEPGDRLIVVADDAPADVHDGHDRRPVRVRVPDAKHVDVVGSVERWQIRPYP